MGHKVSKQTKLKMQKTMRLIARKGKNNNFWKNGKPKCSDCGNEISYGSNKCRFCFLLSRNGRNHPNWKGGITLINIKIRNNAESRLWKKAVFSRDNFTCQKTGISGGYLIAHHINNFADYPELRTSISNGITLSKESHNEFHKIYGRKNNTREQLEEFLCKK